MSTKANSQKRPSQKKVYEIPLRAIQGNTNPRNPLHASLQSQGYSCMGGDKSIWTLAVSEDAEQRAKFVKLIQDFDPDIVSLAATIRSVGLETPVEVREGGSGTFMLVYGARRCLAVLFNWCLLAKTKEPWIEATLVKGNESMLLSRALIENIRKPQTPIEEAKAIAQCLNLGENKEDIAERLGMSSGTINNRLALLDLPPKQQQKIHEGKITVQQARKEHAEANGGPAETKTPYAQA